MSLLRELGLCKQVVCEGLSMITPNITDLHCLRTLSAFTFCGAEVPAWPAASLAIRLPWPWSGNDFYERLVLSP